MMPGSRRASVHTVQGFWVSILPHTLQISIFSSAVCSAAASGAMTCSRFLIRNSAARRAERGPQRQAAGDRLHLLLHHRLGLAARIRVGGDDQILDDLAVGRLEQALVD